MVFDTSDSTLSAKSGQPYAAGSATLRESSLEALAGAVPEWTIGEGRTAILRTFEFKDFPQAIAFVNRLAEVAEEEQHHPDFRVHGYRRVTLEFTTHSLGGLSENDFIMAAKADRLFETQA